MFTARLKSSAEDFIVEERPAYAPSGRGEHLFITFRKRGLTTQDAVRCIARRLGSDPRAAGVAGLKDRHAVTTQTASFAVPIATDPAPLLMEPFDDIEVLSFARHENKLKAGHLEGNTFRIVLREIEKEAISKGIEAFERIAKVGVPNAFGPQRFGGRWGSGSAARPSAPHADADGSNPARAIAWLSGKERGPRDRQAQRFLFSSLQSLFFNRVLDRRVADGTWCEVLPGDLAKKHDTGGMFLVPLEGPEADEAKARGQRGELSATGPMFGKKMRRPEGAPDEIERAILADLEVPDAFDRRPELGEGTRRPLRLIVANVACKLVPEDPSALEVAFFLPKGGYATTVLGAVFELIEVRPPRPADSGATIAPDGETEQEGTDGGA